MPPTAKPPHHAAAQETSRDDETYQQSSAWGTRLFPGHGYRIVCQPSRAVQGCLDPAVSGTVAFQPLPEQVPKQAL